MKKIMIVTHSAGNGGAERVAAEISNQFAEHGYDVTFYAIHLDKRDYYLNDKITYVFCNVHVKNKVLKQIERAIKLKRYIKKNHIDTMISFVCVEGIFLLGNKRVKKIYSLRNDPTKILNSGIFKKLRDIIYRNADRIVFQTPDARDYFDKQIRDKGVIIPNPIREKLPEWDKENHSNDIIAACRITEQKNLKMMIDAFTEFNKRNNQYRLVIYGQGNLKTNYENYVNELHMSDKIIFPGFCNNIQVKMTQAAMYVSSSDYEGISNSMLEALAIGTPTVCTDCPVGGARMFIKSGENGFLVPVGDAMAMAQKMECLAADEQMQIRFSEKSKQIRDDISTQKIYQMWEQII